MTRLTFKSIIYSEWVNEWIKGNYRTNAQLRQTADELTNMSNILFYDESEDGLGRTKEARCITSEGMQFALIQYLQAPVPFNIRTNILTLYDPKTMARDIQVVLELLQLKFNDLLWISPLIESHQYEIWRQDDIGNKFLVERVNSELEALDKINKFESAGHKQTFWVEPHKQE